jgi:hypothetical protein
MSSMLLAAAAAAVAPVPTVSADDALTNAYLFYTVTPPRPKPCPAPKGNEIVVCAAREDPAGQYVPSDADNGVPDDGGVPRAPDLSSLPRGGMVVIKGCFIPPCPPPPALIIDIKALPTPPAGSEADKISKGEMPAP